METLVSTISTITTAIEFVETVANFQFPSKVNQRLQELMDRNNDGKLCGSEVQELETLAELSTSFSRLKAQAFHLLERSP